MPPEIKELVEGIQKDFNDFKKANDERLVLLEKGKAIPAELEQKLEKIEKSLGDQEAQKERLEAVETAIKRGNHSGQSREDSLKEAKAEYSELFQTYMRVGAGEHGTKGWNHEKATRFEKVSQILVEAKILSVQSDPDGGYWVSPDETGRIVERIFETSPMRQVASVQPISTDALEGIVDDDEAGQEWVGETDTPTDTTTPKIGKWRIPVHEQATRPKATNKLLEDSSVNVESFLAGKVARKFARAENLAFVTGVGDARPRGFLTYPATTLIEDFERGKIGQLESASSGTFDFDDLITLMQALKDEYEINSTWAFNRRTKSFIRRLKDLEGQYLWQPSLQVGEPNVLLGRPIVSFEDMPDIAGSALAVAIADWTETYQIVDRTGISVLRDPFTSKPFVEFYTRKRVGGDVINFDSIRILKIKA